MSIRDALKLKNKTIVISDTEFTVRRPSAMDMIEAVQAAKDDEQNFAAWLVWRHLLDGDVAAFSSIDEVLVCDGPMISALAGEIDKLYGEGRD